MALYKSFTYLRTYLSPCFDLEGKVLGLGLGLAGQVLVNITAETPSLGGPADTVDNPLLLEHFIEQNLGTCPPLPMVPYTAQSFTLPPLPPSEDSDVQPEDPPLNPAPSPRTDTEDVLTDKKHKRPDDVITLSSDDAQDTAYVQRRSKPSSKAIRDGTVHY